MKKKINLKNIPKTQHERDMLEEVKKNVKKEKNKFESLRKKLNGVEVTFKK